MTKVQLKCTLDILKLKGEKIMHKNSNKEAELLKDTYISLNGISLIFGRQSQKAFEFANMS